MITVVFSERSGQPLYEQLYRGIREKIETGVLRAGDRLPSKRKMADHLRVSMRTVENAYAQLQVEGYIDALEKKGYFIRQVEIVENRPGRRAPGESAPRRGATGQRPEKYRFDLGSDKIYMKHFPFSVWTKLMRESLRFESETLLEPIHPQGDPDLRRAIAAHLRQFRSMDVDDGQVVLGAGTEYLLGLVADLMRGEVFALENPNFHKWSKILHSRGVAFRPIPMDAEGVGVEALRESGASVLLATPSHHFPLGTVMSIGRRTRLLQWAAEGGDRYIIEDDYDTEYRYMLKPVPALHSLDRNDNVIYMNTFTRTLAPSLRVAFMVLPWRLLERYRSELSFYSSTVSEFEQCILRRFLLAGHYERHLNRIRTVYKNRRDVLLRALAPLGKTFRIHGHAAGLHLLLTSTQGVPESELVRLAAAKGVRVYGLSGYYHDKPPETNTVLIGFAGYDADKLAEAAALLVKAWKRPAKQRKRG